jgi:hypothetical protein
MPSPHQARPIQVTAIAAAWFLILTLLNITAVIQRALGNAAPMRIRTAC